MIIYVDLIIFLNLFFDFLLLFSMSFLLKINVKLYRLFLGAFLGSLSIIFLFIKISSFYLFIFKIIISIIMILISFGFKSIKIFFNNLTYLYLTSIILGGALYFINNMFSYKNIGLIFFHKNYSINIILIILLAPIIIYIYIKKQKNIKEDYSKRFFSEITLLNGKKLNLTSILDTGNNLIDPYKKRPIIVINKNVLKGYNPKCILVPIITVNKKSFIKCFRIKKIVINNKIIKEDVLVGISDNNFMMDGVDLLLHKKIIKEEL